MSDDSATVGLELRSLLKSSGELELSLVEIAYPAPGPDEVLVRVEGSPINPSDLGRLFGPANLSTATLQGSANRPVLTAQVAQAGLRSAISRVDQSLTVGNEGAGVVVKAGSSSLAQSLLGRIVATVSGGMYTQYRMLKSADCLVLPEGTAAMDGASSFINPLTALGMVETMRREGHTALVHTAAASNLGQMLNRICVNDGIDLVNIVRSAEQQDLLRGLGAKYVCNSELPNFV
ncbi:MAG: NADH oxidase, partial [Devosia sp.]